MIEQTLAFLLSTGIVVCAVTKAGDQWYDYLIFGFLTKKYWIYNCDFVVEDVEQIIIKKSRIYIYLNK